MAVQAISDFSKYKGKISNSGHDERGKYSGGKAGDQGGEWVIKDWYPRPWGIVIRFEDPVIAFMIATLAILSALNNLIGYDQGNRTSFWTALKKANYDPSKITTPCEADCSAGVLAIIKAALILTGHKAWADKINVNGYTGNMRSIICNCGAKVKVFSDYSHTHSTQYLLPGDILLNTAAHTAINLGYGSKMKKISVSSGSASKESSSKIPGTCTVTLKQFLVGAEDPQVKTIQRILNARGYKGKDGKALTVDGELGENTAFAITALQKDKGMKDINFGSVAATTWKYLLNA